jgi:glycosyltransferase involved in cell wall biosynthesis
MHTHPEASIVIPTYNRADSLLRVLESLVRQTYPHAKFEVIVVDDGSTDNTGQLAWQSFPFRVRYCHQENRGATEARNTGASLSLAETLVFMDDDIVAAPEMLEHLIQEISYSDRLIVMAALIPAVDGSPSTFASIYSSGAVFPEEFDLPSSTRGLDLQSQGPGDYVHFTKCMTGVLCIRRQAFLDLDMFRDPTGGWPNWDDVDFGYRAHMKGFRLWRSRQATAHHHDYSLQSLELCCTRHERASRYAARFFVRYPELVQYFSAYYHKSPMSFSADPLTLLVRKALRSAISRPRLIAAAKRLAHVLENRGSSSRPLIFLYRWIIGAHIYWGYRMGLHEISRSSFAIDRHLPAGDL